jgi:polysaccharide export outer membrane protein
MIAIVARKRMSPRRSALIAVCVIASVGVAGPVQAQQPPEFRIHAGDELEVAVWKELELTRKVVVRPDGKIGFPLTGEIVAAGRTVASIQAEMTTLLRKYIPEPVVTVTVVGLGGNQVYILGQINKPGAYVMNPQLTVLQALALAGGTTPYAALNDIVVLRGAGAAQKKFSFQYNDVSKGRAREQDILLEGGDVVVVP